MKPLKLTPREQEICERICFEMVDKEIADDLAVSIATVRSHIRNLLRKTQSRNRVGIALAWVKLQRAAILKGD